MMTDTKELAERVREAKHYAERKDHTSAEASRIILAALSELEARLEAAERHLGDASDANCDLHEHLKAAERERDEYREALKQIAYDGPSPGSRKTPELQWASDIAFNALQKRESFAGLL